MYVYILRSLKDPHQKYIGTTNNLKRRFSQHNSGQSSHSDKFRPWKIKLALWFEEAEKAFTNALEINPRYVEAYSNRAGIWYFKGDYDKAIDDYTKALEIDPGNTTAMYNKGNAHFKLNNLEEAESAFNRTLELDPNYSEAWYNKACLASSQGKIYEAISNLEKAFSLDKDKFIRHAKIDRHLDNIRDNARFKELVGQ